MSRIFLMFASALVALMAGALFYAARIPMQTTASPQSVSDEAGEAASGNSQREIPEVEQAGINPAFSLPDIDGNERKFSEWDGKMRLLNFWATWCAPCRREIPILKTFQDEQSGNGFQVIGIAVDYPEEVGRFAESVEFNYPILVGQQDAMAVAETSGIQFMALPFTMFVAADGQFLSAYIGELHADQLNTAADTMTRLKRRDITLADARSELDAL